MEVYMGNVISVNQSNFEAEVIQSKEPVVVDFYATWCPPCKMLAPVLEHLSKEYEGQVKFVKIDTDENEELFSKFPSMGVPTLVFFRDGKQMDMHIGFLPSEGLKEKISQLLKVAG
jgi:thioredoxin 1